MCDCDLDRIYERIDDLQLNLPVTFLLKIHCVDIKIIDGQELFTLLGVKEDFAEMLNKYGWTRLEGSYYWVYNAKETQENQETEISSQSTETA